MKISEFEHYLRKTIHSEKSIESRISKGKKAEEILNMSFDDVVKDDKTVFNSLEKLHKHEKPEHTPMQNSLRHYYKMVNNKEFPRKKNYTNN